MRLILTTDTVGGVWTFTKELASELLVRGHEVRLVSFGRAPSVEQERVAADLQRVYPARFACTFSEVPLEWMETNAVAFDGGASLLLALEETFRPDAYLFSQFCYGALPVETFKVVIAHSDVLSWAAACNESLDEDGHWMRTYRDIVQRGLSQADAVVSPTAAYLLNLNNHFGALPPMQRVIANGRRIAPAAAQERTLQAVSAGRMWDKAKNLQLLFGTSLPMPVVIAGECDDTTSKLNDVLQWIGQQNQAKLLGLFRRSSVYLCTSVYEPFGLAPLEAALCGCAVVAMDIASLREVWGSGAVYFHDSQSLSQRLTCFCKNPKALSQAQARSHARATSYSTARMADQYLKLLVSPTQTQPEASTYVA